MVCFCLAGRPRPNPTPTLHIHLVPGTRYVICVTLTLTLIIILRGSRGGQGYVVRSAPGLKNRQFDVYCCKLSVLFFSDLDLLITVLYRIKVGPTVEVCFLTQLSYCSCRSEPIFFQHNVFLTAGGHCTAVFRRRFEKNTPAGRNASLDQSETGVARVYLNTDVAMRAYLADGIGANYPETSRQRRPAQVPVGAETLGKTECQP